MIPPKSFSGLSTTTLVIFLGGITSLSLTVFLGWSLSTHRYRPISPQEILTQLKTKTQSSTNSTTTSQQDTCFSLCTNLKNHEQISDQNQCISTCLDSIDAETNQTRCNLNQLLTTTCPKGKRPACQGDQPGCTFLVGCYLPWGDECRGPTPDNCHAAVAFPTTSQCKGFLLSSPPSNFFSSLFNLFKTTPKNNSTTLTTFQQFQLAQECYLLSSLEKCQAHQDCAPILDSHDEFSYCIAAPDSGSATQTKASDTYTPVTRVTSFLYQNVPGFSGLFNNLATKTQSSNLRRPQIKSLLREALESPQAPQDKQLNNYLLAQLQARSIIVDGMESKIYQRRADFLTWLQDIHTVAVQGVDGTLSHTTTQNPGRLRYDFFQNISSKNPQEAETIAQAAASLSDPFAESFRQNQLQTLTLDQIPPQASPQNQGSRHTYPHSQYLDLYLSRMHQSYLALASLPPDALRDQVISLAAQYFQYAINAHPFENLNTEIFMNQVNAILESHHLSGVSFGLLDHAALRLQPANFAQYFSVWVLSNQ